METFQVSDFIQSTPFVEGVELNVFDNSNSFEMEKTAQLNKKARSLQFRGNQLKRLKAPGTKKQRQKLLTLVAIEHPEIPLRNFIETYAKNTNSDDSYDVSNYEMSDHISKKLKGKLGRIGKAVISGGASELARTKVGKIATKKAVTGLKKAAKFVKDRAVDSLFLPLLPMKHIMVVAIKKKSGKNMISSNIVDIAKEFHDLFMKKTHYEVDGLENMYDDPLFNYESMEEFESNYDGAQDHIAVAAVAALVPEIIKFIKALKAKKASGEKLSADEANILEQTEKLESDLLTKQQSSGLGGNKMLIIVGVVILAVVGFIMLKKK